LACVTDGFIAPGVTAEIGRPALSAFAAMGITVEMEIQSRANIELRFLVFEVTELVFSKNLFLDSTHRVMG
jgi:hypothetical protein